jgi:hypothetical protein
MQRLSRQERLIIWIWVILAVVVWNGLYDLLLNRSAKDYLLRAALHDAGRGPSVTISHAMHVAVRDAIWISTMWAGLILLAGLVTLRIAKNAKTAKID